MKLNAAQQDHENRIAAAYDKAMASIDRAEVGDAIQEMRALILDRDAAVMLELERQRFERVGL